MYGQYEPNQLLSVMGNGDVVVLALRPFLGKISGKARRRLWLRCKGYSADMGIEPRKIAHLGQDHSRHTEAHSGDGGNRRIEFIHNGMKLFFNFSDLGIQFADESNGVLQFKGFVWYPGANRVSGGISDLKSHVLFVAALRGGFEKCFQPRQMGSGYLFGAGKLLQQSINGSNIQRRNEFFDFWKQDAAQSGDRAFQLGALFYLVKTVSAQ